MHLKRSYNTALSIVKTLIANDFTAYFAGGWVRDYLLGTPSADIDIATSATPEQIQSLFEKTYPVGASFGVVIVRVDNLNFEVATFRKEEDYTNGRHPGSVSYSEPKEDALRRDFTINGMFYDPIDEKIYDFVEGQKDLEAKLIRAIGNPLERFEEDRLRMLRAVRFASALNFEVDPATAEAIAKKSSSLLPAVSMERIWQEFSKMAMGSNFALALQSLEDLGLLKAFLPSENYILPKELESSALAKHPVYAFLFLYPDLDKDFCEKIAQHFKLSKLEEKHLVEALLFKETSLSAPNHIWVKLYANSEIEEHLKLFPSTKHADNRKVLAPFIQRVKDKDPLIKAKDLIALGIQPGKRMGELINLAYEISCDELIENKEELIERVKKLI